MKRLEEFLFAGEAVINGEVIIHGLMFIRQKYGILFIVVQSCSLAVVQSGFFIKILFFKKSFLYLTPQIKYSFLSRVFGFY
jgi:hypothetical protein